MRKHFVGIAVLLLAGCASAPTNTGAAFGPSTALRPSIRSVTEGRNATFTARVALPQEAYLAAVEVYPNQSAVHLGVSGQLSGTEKMKSGNQVIALRTIPSSVTYTAPNWTQADWTRCNSNPRYPGCDEQGYIVLVVSETAFDQTAIAENLASVDLRGTNDDVLHRVGNAVAHATGTSWAATTAGISVMMSPF